jgi:colanic acid biosynthesis glycosyl transferase WcaI
MPGNRRRVVFAEQFYYPDGWSGAQIPRDITTHLARLGLDVCVICGSEAYAPLLGDPGPDPCTSGVRIVRLPRLLGGDIHSFKLLRQLWFYLLAPFALYLRRRVQLYIVQTNPPMIVPIAAAVARLRNAPFMIIAQDLYPEVAIVHGLLREKSGLGIMLTALFRWAYRRAACVVALGPVMLERLRTKGVAPDRMCVISNWATGDEDVIRGEDNLLRDRWGLAGKFVVLYSGNLGLAHDLTSVIRALRKAIAHAPRIRLLIIGKGSRLDETREFVQHEKLDEYVQFQPLVPSEMLPQTIGLADVALVTLRDQFQGLVVPSKLMGYMARGIPTVYVGPRSDVSTIIEESAGGVCFAPCAIDALANELIRMSDDRCVLASMGRAAREFYRYRLARDHALSRYGELVMSLCSSHDSTGPVGAAK